MKENLRFQSLLSERLAHQQLPLLGMTPTPLVITPHHQRRTLRILYLLIRRSTRLLSEDVRPPLFHPLRPSRNQSGLNPKLKLTRQSCLACPKTLCSTSRIRVRSTTSEPRATPSNSPILQSTTLSGLSLQPCTRDDPEISLPRAWRRLVSLRTSPCHSSVFLWKAAGSPRQPTASRARACGR